jgi:BirA family biotin operon repressor/biotin-[acetyl-CoA-carboxylase] ligase
MVADEQTAGRGRFGRAWLSPAGGLYATFIVARHPAIQLVSGVAVLRALARFGIDVRLKWPNDLVIDGRKLAGILVELAGDVALIGIGVNLEEAPLETATSLRAVGAATRRGELIVAMWEELGRAVASEDVLTTYRERLTTLGRPVVVALEGGEAVEGKAVDVDVQGRLLVETASGVRAISSGECTHLRS